MARNALRHELHQDCERLTQVTLVDERPSARDFNAARRAMIDSQLRTSGVNAPFVIARMAAVERERFVPAEAQGYAYIDRAIALGDGRWLAAPLVHGLMLQKADPAGGEAALLVDGGSGYLAELLRPLVASLEVISPEEALEKSRARKKADLLLVDGAAEQLPETLLSRLSDGARIISGTIEGSVTGLSHGRSVGKQASMVRFAEMGVPRLAVFDAPKGWSF